MIREGGKDAEAGRPAGDFKGCLGGSKGGAAGGTEADMVKSWQRKTAESAAAESSPRRHKEARHDAQELPHGEVRGRGP